MKCCHKELLQCTKIFTHEMLQLICSIKIQSNLCYETAQGPEKLLSHKTGGLLTRVNYSENCTLGTLKGQSLNTGGLKDWFDCIHTNTDKLHSQRKIHLSWLLVSSLVH